MHLVDDIYLIGALAGRISRFIAQIADVIHAIVGGCVNLHHVHDAAIVDAFANLAFTAGVCPGAVRAVDRLGKNFGAGGFACAARAGEQIGMAHLIVCNLVLQRGSDARLAHHIRKRLGPPFAVQRAVHKAPPFKDGNKKRTRPQAHPKTPGVPFGMQRAGCLRRTEHTT